MSPAPTRRARRARSARGATHLIKVAVEAAVGKRDQIAVYGTDYDTADGTCIRDYIHVSDLASAHVAALERLIGEPAESLLLNCGYGKGLSVLQVLDAVDQGERFAGEARDGRAQRRRRSGSGRGQPATARHARSWRPAYADIGTIMTHALAWERKLAGNNAAAIAG